MIELYLYSVIWLSAPTITYLSAWIHEGQAPRIKNMDSDLVPLMLYSFIPFIGHGVAILMIIGTVFTFLIELDQV